MQYGGQILHKFPLYIDPILLSTIEHFLVGDPIQNLHLYSPTNALVLLEQGQHFLNFLVFLWIKLLTPKPQSQMLFGTIDFELPNYNLVGHGVVADEVLNRGE